ncbi:MAG: phage holin family protein [Deltaproteobacteria bacterium]|nr:phage holin family protein [Deltaproteobacteria bacterium]
MNPFWGRFFANIAGLVVIQALFGGIYFSGAFAFVFAALVLGIVNAVIRPVVTILSLPITIVTLGVFALIVNGLMLGLVSWLTPGFHIEGCGTTIFAALVLSIVSAIAGRLIGVEMDD